VITVLTAAQALAVALHGAGERRRAITCTCDLRHSFQGSYCVDCLKKLSRARVIAILTPHTLARAFLLPTNAFFRRAGRKETGVESLYFSLLL
jgi:hypothetical protein